MKTTDTRINVKPPILQYIWNRNLHVLSIENDYDQLKILERRGKIEIKITRTNPLLVI